jgi:hypothetical protein
LWQSCKGLTEKEQKEEVGTKKEEFRRKLNLKEEGRLDLVPNPVGM